MAWYYWLGAWAVGFLAILAVGAMALVVIEMADGGVDR